MFDLLEPGCNGVITDYKAIPKSRIKLAFDYIEGLREKGELYDPQQGEEFYDPQEFGGWEMDYDEEAIEGGGDYDFEDYHHRDEL